MSKAEQYIDEISRFSQFAQSRGIESVRPRYQPGTSVHDREPGKLWDDFLMGVQTLNQVANTMGRNRDMVRAASIIKMRLNEMMKIYEHYAPKQPM
jgi:hypothetical protein